MNKIKKILFHFIIAWLWVFRERNMVHIQIREWNAKAHKFKLILKWKWNEFVTFCVFICWLNGEPLWKIFSSETFALKLFVYLFSEGATFDFVERNFSSSVSGLINRNRWDVRWNINEVSGKIYDRSSEIKVRWNFKIFIDFSQIAFAYIPQ